MIVFDGVSGITYPRLSNYGIERKEDVIVPILEMTVKETTRDQVDKTTERPTCEAPGRWPVELRLGNAEKQHSNGPKTNVRLSRDHSPREPLSKMLIARYLYV